MADKQRRDHVLSEEVVEPINDQELAYEEFVANAGESNPYTQGLTEQGFNRIARSTQVDDFRLDAFTNNERIAQRERVQAGQVAQQASNLEYETKIATFQADLDHLGQGGDGVAVDFKNIMEMSIGLLSLEGDDESLVQARQIAAITLQQNQENLAPHFEANAPEWWAANADRINANLPQVDDSFWGRYKGNAAAAAGFILNSAPGKHILNTLASTEQAALQTLLGLRAAVESDDGVSAGAGLAHAGSSAARAVPGFFDQALTGGRLGIADPDRNLTDQDGNVLSSDYSGDGQLNLREALGRTNELSDSGQEFASGIGKLSGGLLGEGAASRFVGLADTVGLAAIDPLSWVSLGQTGRVQAGLRTLQRSSDDVARMAGRRLDEGIPMSQLSLSESVAVERAFFESATESFKAMTPRQLTRAGFTANKNSILKDMFSKTKELRTLQEQIVSNNTSQLDDAIRRGAMPGVRVGGTTLVPMGKVYNALRRINTAAGDASSWTHKMVKTFDLETPEELMTFIHNFDGSTESLNNPDVQDAILGWTALGEEAVSDPEKFLTDLLAGAADRDEAFREIEDFATEMYGASTASGLREVYETLDLEHTIDLRSGQAVETGIPSPVGHSTEDLAAVVGERRADETITAAAQRILGDIEDLPLESARKVRQNMDVFEDPYRWILKDFKESGLRSTRGTDNLVDRLVTRVTDALSPRARIRRAANANEQIDNQVDSVMSVASSKRELFTDHVIRLGLDRNSRSQVAKDALAELGGSKEELNRAVSDVLSSTTLTTTVDDLLAGAGPAFTKYVKILDDIRNDIFGLSVKSGADEAALLARQGYMPRVQTDEAFDLAAKALRDNNTAAIEFFEKTGAIVDGKVNSASDPLSQGGHLKGVTDDRDLQNIYDVNENAAKDLANSGLDGADGFRLYEDDPMRAYLLRSRQAHEAYVYADMLKGMTEVTDTAGRPMAYVSRSEAENADLMFRKTADDATYGKSDMVERTFPNGGTFMVDRNVFKEMEESRRIMGAPNIEGTFRKSMEQWNNIWGAYATVPLVGFGFHARNATGNMYNMMLAGFKNPALLKDAAVAQNAMRRIRRDMADTGASWKVAVERSGLDEGTQNVINNARNYDIVGSGQTADLFGDFDPLAEGGTKNPFNQANPVLASGRALGTAIEDNARLALFMDGIQSGMNPQDAASRTRQYLFDYGDLTKFEANNVRMLSRFYTYMRKNTALQAKVLSTQPGKIANASRLMEEYVDTMFSALGFGEGEEVEAGFQEGGRKVPDWAADNMRLYGQGTLAGVDTPLASFTDTLDSLAAIMRVPVNTGAFIAGKDEDGEDLRSQLRDALQLFSGGPVEGLKTTFEMTTGVDTFTGGDLENIDRTWLDKLFRLTDSVLPVGGKLDRELEYLGAYDAADVFQDEDGNDRNQGSLRLMNAILGLTMVSNLDDPDQITRNMNGLSYELYQALDEARDNLPDGVEVPRGSDLVDMGIVSSRNRALQYMLYNTVAGEPLTAEQRTQMERYVPKSVLNAYGYDVPDSDRNEWDDTQKAARIREQVDAMNALGLDITEDMIQALILRESGARIKDVEALGIEASFRTNSWLNTQDPEEYERLRAEASVVQITSLAAQFGITVEELQDSRPLLQKAERDAQQMREAGLTEQEIVTQLTTGLSRQERVMLFGEDSLETERSYEPLTPDELVKYEQKIAKADAELRVMMQLVFNRQPTAEEQREWMTEVLLTGPEQRSLGLENYSAPRRENVTTDAVYEERRNQKATALEQFGVDLGLG